MPRADGPSRSGANTSSRRPAINEGPAKPDRIYKVSEITRLVKLELENAFPSLWVEGEVSNFRSYPSGHIYFTLKDEQSNLQAVMWRSQVRLMKFGLKDGMKVICRGRLTVYEARGQYQIIAEVIEPKGKGALQLAFEQLK
ncbi:MAG: exodeoxyribonuclease VII large subunit, partial [Candidatus Aminicenantes bacterium]|nr:exodeoxyribonuclease VII large subunit [Candidatus Aminicenantes bacterium]